MKSKETEMTTKPYPSLVSDESGFSLVEISILLIVIGFIFVPILRAIEHDAERDNFTRTLGLIATAENGINTFYAHNGSAYPCPAGLFRSSNDNLSGTSADCTNIANFTNCSDPNWLTDANEGVCRTSGATGNAVIIGAVPYAQGRFDIESSLDVWGNKLIYAVPFLNTDAIASNNYQGIRMVTLNTAGAVAPTTDGEIIVFSTGQTGSGGFTKDGVRVSLCGNAATGYESENCDFDNTFFRNEGSDGVFSRVSGPEFYDDITRTQESYPVTTWYEHQDNPAPGAADKRYAISNAMRVGVGTNSPDNSLHVAGGIRLESGGHATHGAGFEPGGTLQTPSVCDDSGECFEPEKITDSLPEMRCDSAGALHGDQAVMSVNGTGGSGVHVACASPHDSGGSPILEKSLTLDTSVFPESPDCPTGEVAAGIDIAGEVICIIP